MSKGNRLLKDQLPPENLHGNTAAYFIEPRLREGKHREQNLDPGCSPGLFTPDPLLSVLWDGL